MDLHDDSIDPSAALLRQAWAKGRSAWPDIPLPEETFSAHLLGRLDPGEDAAAVIPRLCAPDLYLACAVLDGRPGAVAALRSRYVDDVVRKLPAAEQRPEALEELQQALLVKLLATAPPKLAEYGGRGPLAAWLRVVAIRMAMDVHRVEAKHVPYEESLAERVLSRATDPELVHIQSRYVEHFQNAFRDALRALPLDERLLLRLHYVEGMAIDALAEVRNWSRRTAYRRIEAARETLFAESCRLVCERLQIRPEEIDSLVVLVRSHLHASLFACLKTP